MQARRALVGLSLRLCLYVCMFVCLSVMSLRLEYTGLCIVYLLARAPHDAIARWHGDRGQSRTRKIEDDTRMSPDIWKTVNCSTKG